MLSLYKTWIQSQHIAPPHSELSCPRRPFLWKLRTERCPLLLPNEIKLQVLKKLLLLNLVYLYLMNPLLLL